MGGEKVELFSSELRCVLKSECEVELSELDGPSGIESMAGAAEMRLRFAGCSR